nr:MAG TPA: hypothetical protein [Caudoviricetes sp.]
MLIKQTIYYYNNIVRYSIQTITQELLVIFFLFLENLYQI